MRFLEQQQDQQQQQQNIKNDGRNVTVSNREVQELRQKVSMYERLNKLLEFNSWMSQHGSKMRQNISILSSEYCGSS